MSLLSINEVKDTGNIARSTIKISCKDVEFELYYSKGLSEKTKVLAAPKSSRTLTPMKRLSPFRASPLKRNALISTKKTIDPQVTALKEKLRKVKLAMAYEDELCSKQLIKSINKWKDVAQEAFERLFSLAKNTYPEITETDILKPMGISPRLVNLSDAEQSE